MDRVPFYFEEREAKQDWYFAHDYTTNICKVGSNAEIPEPNFQVA